MVLLKSRQKLKCKENHQAEYRLTRDYQTDWLLHLASHNSWTAPWSQVANDDSESIVREADPECIKSLEDKKYDQTFCTIRTKKKRW